jgi:superfamily II DNA or RNA helicase
LDQAFVTMRSLWWATAGAPAVELIRCHALHEFPICHLPAAYFSTPQMVSARLAAKARLLPRFDFVLFDEAHQAEAKTYKQTLTAVRALGSSIAPAIGLSATPGRTLDEETESLVSLFKSRLLTSAHLRPNAISVLQEQGVLALVEFRRIIVSEKVIGLRRTIESRDQLKGSVRTLQSDFVRFRSIVEKALEVQDDGQTLIFAGSVAHANALCVVLKARGCSADVVSTYTSLEDRVRILKQYSEGKLRVLLNKALLATGYDCPSVKHVILTSPISSPILFEQIVGRASRGPKVGGNKTSIVWQLDNNLAMHGKPNSYHRFRDFDWKQRTAR